MSYILDALRKLEQNRQHGESLTFLTFQGQALRKRKKHRLWPYLLVVALMLNAGVIFWWIGPWQSPGKSMTAEPPAVREVKPAIPTSIPAAGGVQSRASAEKTIVAPKEVKEQPRSTKRDIITPTRSTVRQSPVHKQAPAAEEASVPFKKPSPAPPVRADVTPPADIGVQRSPAPRQAPIAEEAPVPFGKPSPAPPVRADVTPPADARVLKLADLPASVAGGLPEFKISFLYYIAEPQSRVVWINDRTLHEGESLSEGLKVEQINDRSVVMNYRGWRFQLELNR
ncbi:MAG: general secretion pathway protein GspB [Syntrophales bacterium]|nr:general secretion pathway protein GspB [Syntrophales bacterium]